MEFYWTDNKTEFIEQAFDGCFKNVKLNDMPFNFNNFQGHSEHTIKIKLMHLLNDIYNNVYTSPNRASIIECLKKLLKECAYHKDHFIMIPSVKEIHTHKTGLFTFFDDAKQIMINIEPCETIPIEFDHLEEYKKFPTIDNFVEKYKLCCKLIQLKSKLNLKSELYELYTEHSLNLSRRKLTSIPSELSALVNLKHLYLSNNQLTSIPSELSALVNLTYLGLSNNKLSSIPSELSALVNLTHLDLYNNQLTSIPSELRALVNLT